MQRHVDLLVSLRSVLVAAGTRDNDDMATSSSEAGSRAGEITATSVTDILIEELQKDKV